MNGNGYEDRLRKCLWSLHPKATDVRVGRVIGGDEILVEVVYSGHINAIDLEAADASLTELVKKVIPISWVQPPPLIVRELDVEAKV